MKQCPNCRSLRVSHLLSRDEPAYTFHKYHCSSCDKDIHTHEYIQSARVNHAIDSTHSQLRQLTSDMLHSAIQMELILKGQEIP